MNQIRFSDVIDIAAVSRTPVAAWTAICQSFGKPWANSGFIILGGISLGAWIIKNFFRIKKKNARLQPKRSKKKRTNNNSISENQRKNKYEYKIPLHIREVKGNKTIYRKRDLR